MSAVTVVANLPCLNLRKGQVVTVELTDLIQGALDGGKLSLVVPDAPRPVEVDEDDLDDITDADVTAQMRPAPGKPKK